MIYYTEHLNTQPSKDMLHYLYISMNNLVSSNNYSGWHYSPIQKLQWF